MKSDISAGQISSIIEWASETEIVLEIYLFGSRAKGTARPDSDVDLAVIVKTLPNLTNKNSFDQHWHEWLVDLEERLGLEVDLMRLHAENPRTSAAVAEAGVLLYRRSAW